MTNEEKAREIIGGNWMVFNKEYSAAMQMAEWKDQQLKEYLEKKRNEYLSQRDCVDMWSEQWGVLHALACTMNKILQELFSND